MSIESMVATTGTGKTVHQDATSVPYGIKTQRNPPPSSHDAKKQADEVVARKASGTEVESAVQRLSSFVSTTRPELSFSVDENSGTRVVRVIDTETKEVIRQMPSEEAIHLAQALDKLQGLLVKDKA